ncbi:hypothetical protein B9N43_04185 [Denitratisoma sp. DHT3]|nr:hypothetical protein B9N43_04185 [Denitratisoma sp. DHT3]
MPAWRCHLALGILMLTNVFTFAGRQVVSVLLEPIKQEFQISDGALGLVAGVVFALLFGLLSLPAGRLADRANRRGLIACAMFCWGLATWACGWASGLGALVILRLLTAAAEAGVTPPSLSLVPDYYPIRLRGMVMSLYLIGPYLGTLVALGAGGWVAAHHGWRPAFAAIGIPGMVLAVAVALWVPEPRRLRPVAVGAEEPGAPSIFAALASLWAMPAVRWLVIGSGFSSLMTVAYAMWLPAYLVRIHGLPLAQAGLLVAVVGTLTSLVGGLVSSGVSAALSRRNPAWRLGTPILSLALSIPCAMAVFLWPVGWNLGSVPQAMGFAALFGFVSALWMPAVFTAMSFLVPPDRRALANGLLALSNTWIGFGLGPFVVGLLSDALQPLAGPQALRYALVTTMGFGLVALGGFRRAQPHFPS